MTNTIDEEFEKWYDIQNKGSYQRVHDLCKKAFIEGLKNGYYAIYDSELDKETRN